MTDPLAALERRIVARLASAAGMPPGPGAEMVRRAHVRAGGLRFALRATAFLVATRDGARLPQSLRQRAVGGLMTLVVQSVGDLLDHIGHEEGRSWCRGLLVP